jgi:hypothetical protein
LKNDQDNFMARLFKILALLGILLCFTPGEFGVSFAAHESWPVTVELSRIFDHGNARFAQHPLDFRLEAESAEILNPRQPELAESRVIHAQIGEPVHAPLVSHLYSPKVSLQILELVLLL